MVRPVHLPAARVWRSSSQKVDIFLNAGSVLAANGNVVGGTAPHAAGAQIIGLGRKRTITLTASELLAGRAEAPEIPRASVARVATFAES